MEVDGYLMDIQFKTVSDPNPIIDFVVWSLVLILFDSGNYFDF